MNKPQFASLALGVLALCLVIIVPPYYENAGIMGGTVYFAPGHVPASHPSISYNSWLLKWELAFVVLTACSGVLVFRTGVSLRRRKVWCACVVLMGTYLAANLPSFHLILTPEFTFYPLTFCAIGLLIMAAVPVNGFFNKTHPRS
jgi:hypothetical protein